MPAPDNEKSRLDEAARAGWLYFIAGHTQDEIARMLQVSRASAQRSSGRSDSGVVVAQKRSTSSG